MKIEGYYGPVEVDWRMCIGFALLLFIVVALVYLGFS